MMNNQPFGFQPVSLQRLLSTAPGFKRSLRIGRFSKSLAHDEFARMIDQGHQLRFRPASPIDELRKIRNQNLKIIDCGKAGHKINLGPRLLEKRRDGAWPGFSNPFNHSQIPGLMQSLNDFVIDVDPAIVELGIRLPVPIFRMTPGDLQQGFPQRQMFFFIASFVLGIMPGAFRKPQCCQNPVEPIVVIKRPRQLNFFPRSELPAIKFFGSAISTSLCPISRSSSSIRRSYSWIVVCWEKISGPFSTSSSFQSVRVTG